MTRIVKNWRLGGVTWVKQLVLSWLQPLGAEIFKKYEALGQELCDGADVPSFQDKVLPLVPFVSINVYEMIVDNINIFSW